MTNKSREKLEYRLNAIFKTWNNDMYICCESSNIQGTKTFILKPLETKVEHFEFIANRDIEKSPKDIKTFVIYDRPEYK